jgi:hypothetical protein
MSRGPSQEMLTQRNRAKAGNGQKEQRRPERRAVVATTRRGRGAMLAKVRSPAEATHIRYFGVFAPSASVRAKVIGEPALRRRRGREAVQEHCDNGLDEEAARAALRDELGFAPSRSGRLPCPSALAV